MIGLDIAKHVFFHAHRADATWRAVFSRKVPLSTLIGLVLFTLIGVGVRLVMMFTIQQRRGRKSASAALIDCRFIRQGEGGNRGAVLEAV